MFPETDSDIEDAFEIQRNDETIQRTSVQSRSNLQDHSEEDGKLEDGGSVPCRRVSDDVWTSIKCYPEAISSV